MVMLTPGERSQSYLLDFLSGAELWNLSDECHLICLHKRQDEKFTGISPDLLCPFSQCLPCRHTQQVEPSSQDFNKMLVALGISTIRCSQTVSQVGAHWILKWQSCQQFEQDEDTTECFAGLETSFCNKDVDLQSITLKLLANFDYITCLCSADASCATLDLWCHTSLQIYP